MRATEASQLGRAKSAAKATLSLTRRTLLAGTAVTIGTIIHPDLCRAAAAVDLQIRFLDVSSRLTEKTDLSAVTSRRILAALAADGAGFEANLVRLAALGGGTPSGMALKTLADADGLEAIVVRIVTAWYCGTIDTKSGPVVVSYKDALMYRPVADGLTVPTYCSSGPVWWSGLPPEINRMPVNFPKVL